MPHIKCNWVDILFVTLLIRICYVAFKTGFVSEFFRFFGLLIAFIVSFNNYTSLSAFISIHTRWSGAKLDIISFLFIFLALLFIFKMLAIAVKLLLGSENISGLNRFMGMVLGFGRGILLTSLIYVLFVNGPFEYLSASAKDRSFLGKYISKVAPAVYKSCINFYPAGKNETYLVKLLEKV